MAEPSFNVRAEFSLSAFFFLLGKPKCGPSAALQNSHDGSRLFRRAGNAGSARAKGGGRACAGLPPMKVSIRFDLNGENYERGRTASARRDSVVPEPCRTFG